MKKIIISGFDYTRIKKCISDAIQYRMVEPKEADALMKELNTAKIVKPQEIPSDVITMNSIVKLKFLNTQKNVQLQLVFPDQANLKEGKISIFSPVAAALIGYKVKDIIEWVVPAGKTKIKIEELIYQPEADGRYDL